VLSDSGVSLGVYSVFCVFVCSFYWVYCRWLVLLWRFLCFFFYVLCGGVLVGCWDDYFLLEPAYQPRDVDMRDFFWRHVFLASAFVVSRQARVGGRWFLILAVMRIFFNGARFFK